MSAAAKNPPAAQPDLDRLRDAFAMAALTGMNASMIEALEWPNAERAAFMAEAAYRQADAMLAERAKERGE